MRNEHLIRDWREAWKAEADRTAHLEDVIRTALAALERGGGFSVGQVKAILTGCPCACHEAIQPGLVPCPNCDLSSRTEAPDA